MGLCKNGSREGVLLIAAGGTIAAEPYEQTPRSVTVKSNAHVIEAFERMAKEQNALARVWDYAVVDSKKIKRAGVSALADAIIASPEQGVVIAQGTDGMRRNARLLEQMLRERCPQMFERDSPQAKVIVFTGAMEPIKNGAGSDGQQNLEDAVEMAVHGVRPGVHVVMHRQIFDAWAMTKDFGKKAFYESPKQRARALPPEVPRSWSERAADKGAGEIEK